MGDIPDTLAGDIARFREVSGTAAKPGLIEVHIIRPGRGSSGYYTDEVLRKACETGVYHAGMLMHWDHPTPHQEEEQPARVTGTIAASFIEDATYREENDPAAWDGPGPYTRADVRPKFREDLKWLSGKIGVSHYVDGKSREAMCPDGKKGRLITELIRSPLNSVDFVTVPGAGGHSRFNEVLSREEVGTLPETLREIIRHEGGKWVLYSHDGSKVLGTFETEEQAKDRERQIQFFKHEGESVALKTNTGPDTGELNFVIGFPKGGGGSETQSVIFGKEKWTPEQARTWLKKWSLKSGDMEETGDSYLFRQVEPDTYERFRIVVPQDVHHVSNESRGKDRMTGTQLSIRLSEILAKEPEVVAEIRKQVTEELKIESLNESQKTKLAETETRIKTLETENKSLKLKLAEKAARDYIATEIGKAKLPETAGNALTEALVKQVVIGEDGTLDTVKFATVVAEAVKQKQDEIAAILKESGASGIHDNGGLPGGAAPTDLGKAREAYRDMLLDTGMAATPAEANAMAGIKVS